RARLLRVHLRQRAQLRGRQKPRRLLCEQRIRFFHLPQGGFVQRNRVKLARARRIVAGQSGDRDGDLRLRVRLFVERAAVLLHVQLEQPSLLVRVELVLRGKLRVQVLHLLSLGRGSRVLLVTLQAALTEERAQFVHARGLLVGLRLNSAPRLGSVYR